jgi:hypothetical protein
MPNFSDIPWLTRADLQLIGAPSWDKLDEVASKWLGHSCIALPSVRVGLCWALDKRGYLRQSDHILVPRFVGRCILNSVGRFAFPVESPTAKTRVALVVDQFGKRQKINEMLPHFEKNQWSYIEDSPYGIGADEKPGTGSLGRFVGLTKVLPVVQGALFVAGDESISQAIRLNRQKTSPWALPVWLTMLLLRKRFSSGYSDMADAAYEMYPAARGGSFALRGNIAAVFRKIKIFEYECQERMAAVVDSIGNQAIVPDQCRLGYTIPFVPGASLAPAKATLRKFGFADSTLHVDTNLNMLTPNYVSALVVPINPVIPRKQFEQLLLSLNKLF